MREDILDSIDRAQKVISDTGKIDKIKWYAIPPYRNEGWKVIDANGELVATFEERDQCEYVVELHNKLIKEMEAHNE